MRILSSIYAFRDPVGQDVYRIPASVLATHPFTCPEERLYLDVLAAVEITAPSGCEIVVCLDCAKGTLTHAGDNPAVIKETFIQIGMVSAPSVAMGCLGTTSSEGVTTIRQPLSQEAYEPLLRIHWNDFFGPGLDTSRSGLEGTLRRLLANAVPEQIAKEAKVAVDTAQMLENTRRQIGALEQLRVLLQQPRPAPQAELAHA